MKTGRLLNGGKLWSVEPSTAHAPARTTAPATISRARQLTISSVRASAAFLPLKPLIGRADGASCDRRRRCLGAAATQALKSADRRRGVRCMLCCTGKGMYALYGHPYSVHALCHANVWAYIAYIAYIPYITIHHTAAIHPIHHTSAFTPPLIPHPGHSPRRRCPHATHTRQSPT